MEGYIPQMRSVKVESEWVGSRYTQMVYIIAMGANLSSRAGGPLETLQAAVAALEARGVTIAARGRWYRSAAWPPGSGPDFINSAATIVSPLRPDQLLAVLHQVEHDLGRSRDRRWEPRVCDLDLVACEGLVLPSAPVVAQWMQLPPEEQRLVTPLELILPHPRLHQRAFVLAPLLDIMPDWVHPVLGMSAREMYAALPDDVRGEVVPL